MYVLPVVEHRCVCVCVCVCVCGDDLYRVFVGFRPDMIVAKLTEKPRSFRFEVKYIHTPVYMYMYSHVCASESVKAVWQLQYDPPPPPHSFTGSQGDGR